MEVRERWGGADPKRYEEVTQWFRGKKDVPGTPCGAQVWLDLCRWCDQDPVPYDDLPAHHPTKLTIEHLFCRSMGGDWAVLRNGIMGLYAVEWGFNNSAEFKTIDSLAEQAFLGQRTYRNHVNYISWLHTKKNHTLPSLAFLMSTHCVDTDLAAPIYLSSGLRATGRTRQLYLPFGAAQGLRSGMTRAHVDDEAEQDVAETPAPVPTPIKCDAGTQTDQLSNDLAATISGLLDRYENCFRTLLCMAKQMKCSKSHNAHNVNSWCSTPDILESLNRYVAEADGRTKANPSTTGELLKCLGFYEMHRDFLETCVHGDCLYDWDCTACLESHDALRNVLRGLMHGLPYYLFNQRTHKLCVVTMDKSLLQHELDACSNDSSDSDDDARTPFERKRKDQ